MASGRTGKGQPGVPKGAPKPASGNSKAAQPGSQPMIPLPPPSPRWMYLTLKKGVSVEKHDQALRKGGTSTAE